MKHARINICISPTKSTGFSCEMHCHLYHYVAFSSLQNINQIQPLCPLSKRIPQLHCPLMRAWRKPSQGSWLTARLKPISISHLTCYHTKRSNNTQPSLDTAGRLIMDGCFRQMLTERQSVYYACYALEEIFIWSED